MKTTQLTEKQLEALHMISLSKNGSLWTGDAFGLGKEKYSRAVADVTAKSLAKRGLVKFHNASGWRSQGIGCWACYRVTDVGRQVIAIGRMLAPLQAVRS